MLLNVNLTVEIAVWIKSHAEILKVHTVFVEIRIIQSVKVNGWERQIAITVAYKNRNRRLTSKAS